MQKYLDLPLAQLSRKGVRRKRLDNLKRAYVVNSNEYSQGGLSASSARGPSPVIWADCPVLGILEDPGLGMYVFDDFLLTGSQGVNTSAVTTQFGNWMLYGGASANTVPNIVDEALEGGVISLSSDGGQEPTTLASSTGGFRLTTTSTLALNRKLWFETRVAFSTIATTKMDCFIGLSDKLVTSGISTAILPITATDDALSTVPNLIGFHKKSGASTEINFVYQLAGGTAVYPTGMTTLMNTCTGAVLVAQSGQTGFVKLGFLFDPDAPAKIISTASTGQTAGQLYRPLIRVFVNGLECGAFLTSTNVAGTAFPTGFMGPVISNMQTATGSNKLYADWIRVAQLANS